VLARVGWRLPKQPLDLKFHLPSVPGPHTVSTESAVVGMVKSLLGSITQRRDQAA
jgi:hypothetical protein